MNVLPKEKGRLFSARKQKLFELLLKEGGIDLPPRPAIPKKDPSQPCLLTIAQEQLWQAWRSEPFGEASNEVVLLRLSGPLNIMALIQALNNLVRRHKMLRTRFVEVDGQVCQHASAQMSLEVLLADLSHLPASQQEAKWKRLCNEQASTAFDLAQLPLIRSSILAFSPHGQLLLLTLHQIICDGWSRKILVNELSRSYESMIVGAPPELDDLEISYCDFAMWQRQQLQTSELDQDIKYWKRKLRSGLPPLGLWAGLIGATSLGRKRELCRVRLSDATSQRVRQTSRSQGLTVYMILLAGWQVLLSLYSGREEFAVTTVVANRGRVELQSLIGPVANTLPIKADFRGDLSFREVIRKLRKTAIKAFEHQEVPYGLIRAEAARPPGGDESGLAEVMFVIEEGSEELQFGGLKAVEERLERSATRSDLAMVIRPVGKGFEGRIEYNTTLFDEEGIMQMAVTYQRLMEVMLSDLDGKIKSMVSLVN
jgi:hypothetical protein